MKRSVLLLLAGSLMLMSGPALPEQDGPEAEHAAQALKRAGALLGPDQDREATPAYSVVDFRYAKVRGELLAHLAATRVSLPSRCNSLFRFARLDE
jgi:hypothetical protein